MAALARRLGVRKRERRRWSTPADKEACCGALATCGDADGDGARLAGVSDADCGAGFVARPVADTTECQSTSCDIAGSPADKAACCVAVATCGDADGEGPGTAPISSADCGSGLVYDTSASAALCASAMCDIAGTPADKEACCAAALCAENEHVVDQTCSPCPHGTFRPAGDSSAGADTECITQATCGDADGAGSGTTAVADADCGPAFYYNEAQSGAFCAGAECDVSGSGRDRRTCCVPATRACLDNCCHSDAKAEARRA